MEPRRVGSSHFGSRDGLRCARTSTTVGEVAPRKASGEWFGAECANGSLALLSCSPRSFHNKGAPDPDAVQDAANQRVIKLEAMLRAMGDYDGPELLPGANRFRIKLRRAQNSFLVPRNGCQCGEERVREQELLDKAVLRQERLRCELESE